MMMKIHSDKTGFHNVSSAARNVKVSEWPLILTIDPKLSKLGASRSKLRTPTTFSDSRLGAIPTFSDAREEGRRAFRDGTPCHHNPYRGYKQHERLAREWAAGWIEAAQVLRDDKDEG
jgi:hypothetical protein